MLFTPRIQKVIEFFFSLDFCQKATEHFPINETGIRIAERLEDESEIIIGILYHCLEVFGHIQWTDLQNMITQQEKEVLFILKNLGKEQWKNNTIAKKIKILYLSDTLPDASFHKALESTDIILYLKK